MRAPVLRFPPRDLGTFLPQPCIFRRASTSSILPLRIRLRARITTDGFLEFPHLHRYVVDRVQGALEKAKGPSVRDGGGQECEFLKGRFIQKTPGEFE